MLASSSIALCVPAKLAIVPLARRTRSPCGPRHPAALQGIGGSIPQCREAAVRRQGRSGLTLLWRLEGSWLLLSSCSHVVKPMALVGIPGSETAASPTLAEVARGPH